MHTRDALLSALLRLCENSYQLSVCTFQSAVKYLLQAEFHWNPELPFSTNSQIVLFKMYKC